MDKVTWPDADVLRWFDDHALGRHRPPLRRPAARAGQPPPHVRGPEADALEREAVRLDPGDEMKRALAEAPAIYA
jgi:hypothetical protein